MGSREVEQTSDRQMNGKLDVDVVVVDVVVVVAVAKESFGNVSD